MAVFNAREGMGCSGGYANPCVSADLATYDFIGWPATQADIAPPGAYALTRVLAQGHPSAITAGSAHSYADDYYDRIHVIPPLIALGNLLSAQTRQVSVWNAWRSKPQTLNGLEIDNASGITVTDPVAYPVVMQPLQLLTWQIAIDVKGAPVIDAQVRWLFSNPDQPVLLAITGQRTVAFFARPNWADGVTERLSFATDVLVARHSRREQRRSLRATPRRAFEFSLALQGDARRRAATRLFGWSSSVYALPIWPHAQRLGAPLAPGAPSIACTTAARDFAVKGLAIITDERDYEAVEVQAIAAGSVTLARPSVNAWGADAWFIPARLARLTSTSGAHVHSDAAPLRVAFETVEPCTWPVAELGPVYRGWPVLERRPNWRDGLDLASARETDTLDVVSQPVFEIDPSGLAFPTQAYRTVLRSLADQAAWRGWLYARNGRQKAVWVPSFTADIRVRTLIASNDTTLAVGNLDYTLFLKGAPGRRDIRIQLADGTVFYRHITDSSIVADGETLALDAPLGRTLAPADIAQVGWLQLCRLAADDVEIQHYAVGRAEATAAVIGVRDDDV